MRAVPLSRYLVFGAIVSVGCIADLTTKAWAFGLPQLRGGRILWIWPNVFGLQTSLNEGALFGVGQGQVSLFAILSIAALIGILVWLFAAGAARNWLLTVALGTGHGGDSRQSVRPPWVAGPAVGLRQRSARPGRAGLCRPRLDSRDDWPLALAKFQHRRPVAGRRRDPPGLARLFGRSRPGKRGKQRAARSVASRRSRFDARNAGFRVSHGAASLLLQASRCPCHGGGPTLESPKNGFPWLGCT